MQPTGSSLPKVGTQYTVDKLVYQVKTSATTDKTIAYYHVRHISRRVIIL